MAKEKIVKEKKAKPVKEKKEKVSKKQKVQTQPKIVEYKKPHVSKRQAAYMEKKSRLAVAGRQTKWAPVWVVIKKYGMGKRIHPSAVTAYRRNWRRTKLDIRPRKIRKWHMG
ncbi:MAG: hypothetical protein M1416_03455 [Candidatus Pacearchaeota archaeon]|nr:hypothetical protein [Candidatus Pacearchaeota archaeon]